MGDTERDPEEILESSQASLHDLEEIDDDHENEDTIESDRISFVSTSLPQFYRRDSQATQEEESSLIQIEDVPHTPVASTHEREDSASNSSLLDDDDVSLPSRQHSRHGSLQLHSQSPTPSISPSRAGLSSPGTPSSIRSSNYNLHSLDQRFKTRLSSLTSTRSPSTSSTLSKHIRTASQLSNISIDDLSVDPSISSPWEPMRWTKLRKLSSQLYSDAAVSKYGVPTIVLPASYIAIGTSKGFVLVFDYLQHLKHVLGAKSSVSEYGEVSALAISADQTYIGVAFTRGYIVTWDLNKPSSPNILIAPIPNGFSDSPPKDGHVIETPIVHLNFSGKRHSALISADVKGLVFSHDTIRTIIGRSVRTKKVLGKYLQSGTQRKPTSILACTIAPLGTEPQAADDVNLVAIMTPYMLAIVSTFPQPQTEYKVGLPKHLDTSMGLSACLAWFPSLKGGNKRPRLAYCFSNVLTVLEIRSSKNEVTDSVSIGIKQLKRYNADESIVAVHWLNKNIIALVTVTQRLLILNEETMALCERIDLINKHVMHHDYYSTPLQYLRTSTSEGSELPAVVADAYTGTIKAFKGRLFLVGKYEFVIGSLSNWADRLLDIMESGDYIRSLQLATSYYVGSNDMITIGLPIDDAERHEMVNKSLPDLISASLRHSFRPENSTYETSKMLADACFTAIITMNAEQSLLGDIFDIYESAGKSEIYFESLSPFILDGEITQIPPNVFKNLVLDRSEHAKSEELEELICGLDTSTLDLDLTLSLCKQLGLLDTQFYIWNHSLHDYVTPLQDLLELIKQIESPEMDEPDATLVSQAEKIFPYLSYILTGRIYPTGFPNRDLTSAFKARSDIYHLLFTSSDGYPELSRIINFGSSAFFAAMNEAFEDSFLNEEKDVPSNIHPNEQSLFGQTVTRQFIIDVLLEVFAIGLVSEDAMIFFDIFIARNYPKYSQFLILPGHVLSTVLENLCHCRNERIKEDCDLAIESLLTKYKPHDLDQLLTLLYEVKNWKALQFIFRSEKRYVKLMEITLNAVIEEVPNVARTSLLPVIRECFVKTKSHKKDYAMIENLVSENFEILVSLDCDATVEIVQEFCPALHDQVFGSLANQDDLQYRYLRALFGIAKTDGTVRTPGVRAKQLYVTILIKRREIDQLRALLNTTLTDVDDVDLPSAVDDLIAVKAIDILALLLERRGRFSEAMIYIVDHLIELAEEYDNTVDEKRQDLGDELVRYVYTGIDLCLHAEDRVEKHENDGKAVDELEASLGEKVWARLIDTLIEIARPLENQEEATASLKRGLLQKALSTLLDSTGQFVSRDQHNLTIIRIFKSVLTPQSVKSRTIGAVRPILNDLLAAYTYQQTMLTAARRILDVETFDSLLHLVSVRLKGWRVSRSGECEGCGRRIIGVGVDAEWLYDQWEKWRKRTLHKSLNRVEPSKKQLGKRIIDSTEEEEHEANLLVVFNCGHTYHMRCLKSLGRGSRDIKCILCN